MSIDRIGTRLLGWAVVIVASPDGQTCRWGFGDSGVGSSACMDMARGA
jgi:hypothetical protein